MGWAMLARGQQGALAVIPLFDRFTLSEPKVPQVLTTNWVAYSRSLRNAL